MPKPIFIVSIPFHSADSFRGSITAFTKYAEKNKLSEEYFVIIISHNPVVSDEVKFQCFYDKDFDEIKYEELKQKLLILYNGKDNITANGGETPGS